MLESEKLMLETTKELRKNLEHASLSMDQQVIDLQNKSKEE